VTVVVSDELIDACGFRMFTIPEIARTMQMHEHPAGGEYNVTGNKRERMRKYGNAVTPPVTALLAERFAEVLGGGFDFVDVFCGAGGTTIGPEKAGLGKLKFGVNHWRSAVDDHASNFPDADHDCADVSALTTAQIRRYPDADVLFASPECTNHSIAKGARRRKPQAASLFDDGPAGDDEQDRSRATMWDVCRFLEQKQLKGKPFRIGSFENVVDAFKWGANDNGLLFQAWRQALEALDYRSEIVWLNSMFVPPTPQSRDRMYVVVWHKSVKAPNLRIEPISWCLHCEKLVNGRQVWKRPDSPVHQRNGKPTGGKYGQQYLYACPDCRAIVIPGACPAITAIDQSEPAPLIGDRKNELEPSTYERVRRGLTRLLGEPFAIRLTHGGTPKPLTLPLVTLTARHDMAMVIPMVGNTFERTPGNRARDAATEPYDVVCAEDEPRAIVFANTQNAVPRPAVRECAPTLRTEGGLGLVELQSHGIVRDATEEPAGTMRAGGFHHAIVVRNNGDGGSGSGWESTPGIEPIRTLTAGCHQSIVFPYQSEAHHPDEPVRTITTRDRMALIVPPLGRKVEGDGE
jgi:DNA (cytosine-5)-methyltransferase 1